MAGEWLTATAKTNMFTYKVKSTHSQGTETHTRTCRTRNTYSESKILTISDCTSIHSDGARVPEEDARDHRV